MFGLMSNIKGKYNFNYEELINISEIDFPTGLDPAEQSVYYYSAKIEALILSGDRRLKTFYEAKEIEVREYFGYSIIL